MSSLDKRRDDVARTQNARMNLSLSSRKIQIKKEIQTLLRDKTANMIDASLQLSLLRRVVVLLSALIVEKTMNAKFKEMNKKFKNIEQNINKTTTTIESYAAIAKTKSRLKESATTTKFAKFNNLNHQRQLNEFKKNKTLIYKIKKKNEKTKIKALFNKKLMKRIIRAEEQKNDVLTIKRLFSENIKILTRFVKTKQRLKQNKTLFKDDVMTIFFIASYVRDYDSRDQSNVNQYAESTEDNNTHNTTKCIDAFELENNTCNLIKACENQFWQRIFIAHYEDIQRNDDESFDTRRIIRWIFASNVRIFRQRLQTEAVFQLSTLQTYKQIMQIQSTLRNLREFS